MTKVSSLLIKFDLTKLLSRTKKPMAIGFILELYAFLHAKHNIFFLCNWRIDSIDLKSIVFSKNMCFIIIIY